MSNGNFPCRYYSSDLLPLTEDVFTRPVQEKQPAGGVTRRGAKRNILLEQLYSALRKRSQKQPPPGYDEWICTRDLAEDCEMGIYQTRSMLLKLVEQQRIVVTPAPIANSLRWYAVIKDHPHETTGNVS